MSNRALNHVWQHSKARGSALLVMIAIADMANDEGDCWPGRTNLAAKCRMGIRNLQAITAKLAKAGELKIFVNDGKQTAKGKTNRYRVVGVNQDSPQAIRGESDCTPGVNQTAPHEGEGVNQDSSLGVNQTAPDPSIEPSFTNDPSVEPAEPAVADKPTLPKVVVQVIDPNLARVSKHYEANIGMITQRIAENLKAACDEYPAEWIIEAINEAVDHNARNWKYAHAILKRWNAEGKDDGRQNGQANAARGTGAAARESGRAPETDEERRARVDRGRIRIAERLRREQQLHSPGGSGNSGQVPGLQGQGLRKPESAGH